ncbi:hypothetical protein EVAR_61595_1 [Eumeta japonica]|uniref:Uncharacterized protein n=1 Tax=Eumeta variegata TaxID=151549 RepID=A0A4C1YJY6_EUMVA|nr:hypothetical protein EVAR_61595_1 [Eumeta japonica]
MLMSSSLCLYRHFFIASLRGKGAGELPKVDDHPQLQMSHRHVAGLLGGNRISNGGKKGLIERRIVSELKTGRGTKSRAKTAPVFENRTGVNIECGIGIRIESLFEIEIQKMKELFALSFFQIRTVIGSGIRIESGTGNRMTIESGTEIQNGTGVEYECGIGIRIKSMTGIGIESENGIEIDFDRYKR